MTAQRRPKEDDAPSRLERLCTEKGLKMTVRLFEEASILSRHDFGDGRARYEEAPEEHHDHLIDIQSGKVTEFHNERIEDLQRQIAKELGYELVGHRLELYGTPLRGRKPGPRQ
jgi:Fur family ferric uptake transcriptional regulator